MDGILVLDKPAGYTSFDCVAIARRAAQETAENTARAAEAVERIEAMIGEEG